MNIQPRPVYTCRDCRRTGTEDAFDSIKWSNKTGICKDCAEKNEDHEQQPLTQRDIYNIKVDESKEG